MKRLVVDPPVSDARRDRVERQLFAQLAAVRVTDRADAAIPPVRKSRLGVGLALAGFAAAAAGLFLIITRDGDRGGPVVSPSRVVTPVGGSAQFQVPGALIDARSDTIVEWQQSADGALTLNLSRGSVECDVEPRGHRAPFYVVAGDVKVTVVGTRFTVALTPSPRVDVARGKVRVAAPGGEWLVEGGESWPPPRGEQTAAVPPPPPAPEPEIEMDPMQVPKHVRAKKPDVAAPDKPPATYELAKEAYRVAQSYEDRDPELAAANYRAIARGKDTWAALALVSLADMQINKLKNPQAALATLDEHARRFPRSSTREEAAWYRIVALRALGKRDEARGAAADYLRQFPNGAYAEPAARLTK